MGNCEEKMKESRLEAGIIAGLQRDLTAKIDAQTIYHLLIDKGICTREEIQSKKKYISKQYEKEQDALTQRSVENLRHIVELQVLENYSKGKTKEEQGHVIEYCGDYAVKVYDDGSFEMLEEYAEPLDADPEYIKFMEGKKNESSV